MDLRKLKTLIDLVSESNISELEITEAEGQVRIVKAGAANAQPMMMMAAAPALDEASKAKLAESNRIKAANVVDLYAMMGELMLKMFDGDIGSVIETGQYLNHYSRNVCQVINRQVEVAKQSGIPEPQMDKTKLSQSML